MQYLLTLDLTHYSILFWFLVWHSTPARHSGSERACP